MRYLITGFTALCFILLGAEVPKTLDLEIQLLAQRIETINAQITILEAQRAKQSEKLKTLIDVACEQAKIEKAVCRVKVSEDKVTVEEANSK